MRDIKGEALVVRLNRQTLPLFNSKGERLDVLQLGEALGPRFRRRSFSQLTPLTPVSPRAREEGEISL